MLATCGGREWSDNPQGSKIVFSGSRIVTNGENVHNIDASFLMTGLDHERERFDCLDRITSCFRVIRE